MRKLGLRGALLALGVLAVAFVVACGGGRRRRRRRRQGGRLDANRVGASRRVRPRDVPDGPGEPAASARLQGPRHLRGRGGKRWQQADPGPRRGDPRAHRRRHEVRVPAPQGPQVLRRHAGQGQRLREHDQAPALPGRPVLVIHDGDQGRREVPGGRRSRTPTSPASRPTTRTGKITVTLEEPDSQFLMRSAWRTPRRRRRRSRRSSSPTTSPAPALTRSRSQPHPCSSSLTKNAELQRSGHRKGQGRQDHRGQGERVRR